MGSSKRDRENEFIVNNDLVVPVKELSNRQKRETII